jgi:heme/copper-type cytochrome/quinol oxidase subunit 2
LIYNFGDTVRAIFDKSVDLIQWATPYVILGAIVVVPIWLVMMVARYARERQKK